MLHVVLFRPLIPANTGNIGRTCLGFGARLHLIKPLGFDLSEREVKRAGLDHWNHVDLAVHDSWRSFTESTLPMLSHDSSAGSGKESRRDKTNKSTNNIYLVSKRLKLGSYPIADVNFFPPTPRPPPPPPSLPTPARSGSASGLRGRLDGGGEGGGGGGGGRSKPESITGNTGSSGVVESGALPLSPSMCGGSSSGSSGSDSFSNDVALVFGNEVDGLSGLEEGETGRSLPAVYLPMRDDVIRSYNLSNAVAMAVYEVDRQRRESRRRPRGESADGTT